MGMSGLAAGMLFCLLAPPVAAQDEPVSAARLISDEPGAYEGIDHLPLPLLRNPPAGLAFDIAGSDQRKLSLQLSEPLSIEVATGSRWLSAGGGSLLAGSSLAWAATNRLNLGATVERSQVEFRPLGSIHCENGVLAADSYRASDCYFVNDANDLDIGLVSVGAEYRAADRALAAISLFRQEATADPLDGARAMPLLDAGVLSPMLSNPALAPFSVGQGLDYLDSELTGIDLEFKLGVSTDRAGDMQLGLQFTHVLDGDFQALQGGIPVYSDWSLAAPFDSARLSFDWHKNSFSGGVQGYYREPMQFLNRSDLDAMATFDVYFTWRAPWNASLSVGASNVLNTGADKTGAEKAKLADPFEAVYGRIPYVRYQQDL